MIGNVEPAMNDAPSLLAWLTAARALPAGGGRIGGAIIDAAPMVAQAKTALYPGSILSLGRHLWRSRSAAAFGGGVVEQD